MDEINDIHSTSLEWGAITNIVDRISEIESKMDEPWDELIDIIANAIDEESQNKDPETIFFTIYQYIFRLYYRIRSNPTKRKFNIISKVKDGFRVTNYDSKTFKWASAGGFIMTISNDYIDLPMDKLTTSQARAFERRLEKGDK